MCTYTYAPYPWHTLHSRFLITNLANDADHTLTIAIVLLIHQQFGITAVIHLNYQRQWQHSHSPLLFRLSGKRLTSSRSSSDSDHNALAHRRVERANICTCIYVAAEAALVRKCVQIRIVVNERGTKRQDCCVLQQRMLLPLATISTSASAAATAAAATSCSP